MAMQVEVERGRLVPRTCSQSMVDRKQGSEQEVRSWP